MLKNKTVSPSHPKGMFAQALACKGTTSRRNQENLPSSNEEDTPYNPPPRIIKEISLECDEVLISPKPMKKNSSNQNRLPIEATVEKETLRTKRSNTTRRESHTQLDLLCDQDLGGGPERSKYEQLLQKTEEVLSGYQSEVGRLREYIQVLELELYHRK